MNLFVLAMPLGGGLTALVEPTALADDSGARPGGKKGGDKKGKGKNDKDNDGVGPFKKGEYPIAERMRPLTLPKSMGEVRAEATYAHYSILGEGVDAFSLGAGFEYGVANIVQIGLRTGFLLAPDADWNRNLTLDAHFLAYDTKNFDFAPGVVVPFNFVEGGSFGLTVDASSRYTVPGSKFFFRFGQGALQIVASPDFALGLNANGGVAYQIDKPFMVFLDTTLLSVVAAGDVTATGPWDYLTFGLGGQYSPSKMVDVGLGLNYGNAWEVEEDLLIGLTGYGRFRF